jgi:purine-binding chemotaxis protein CheW
MMETYLKVVTFKLGEEEYALDIQCVQSIERVTPITRVPNAPHFVKGVINLRGNVTPIIDLRTRFGMEEWDATENTRIIICKQNGIEVGIVVDQTTDVIDIPTEVIETPSKVSSQVEAEYIEGIVNLEGRLIVLLRFELI